MGMLGVERAYLRLPASGVTHERSVIGFTTSSLMLAPVRGPMDRHMEVNMRPFVRWTVITAASAAGATLVYRSTRSGRTRLGRGLERVERIADNAQRAVGHMQEALEHTARSVRDIRRTIG